MHARITLLGAAVAAVAACGEARPEPGTAAVAAPLTGIASAYEAAVRVRLAQAQPENHADLHNVYRLSRDVISGGEPHGEAGLERVARMGVKTILSVDGKVPDAETAARHGMRYVHVPIHYRGITERELVRIVKTFRELKGPFYVHCFHGKHRGPAAAAVGRLVLDGVSRERAIAEMRQWCGTSDKYEGLYQAVAAQEIPSPEQTRRYAWDFPAAHHIEGFRKGMIGVSRAFDHLKALSGREWKPDPDHPDVDPVNEADKLAGLFERLGGLDELRARPADFLEWTGEAAREARRLNGALADLERGDGKARGPAGRSFRALKKLCDTCHVDYRND